MYGSGSHPNLHIRAVINVHPTFTSELSIKTQKLKSCQNCGTASYRQKILAYFFFISQQRKRITDLHDDELNQ
jgi:hypothetical protein